MRVCCGDEGNTAEPGCVHPCRWLATLSHAKSAFQPLQLSRHLLCPAPACIDSSSLPSPAFHAFLCVQDGGPGTAAIITQYGRQREVSEQRQQQLKQRMVSPSLVSVCICCTPYCVHSSPQAKPPPAVMLGESVTRQLAYSRWQHCRHFTTLQQSIVSATGRLTNNSHIRMKDVIT